MSVPLPYRRGVGIMLLNKKSEVFVAKRIDMKSEAWQMPQGGIDGDETPEQAAMRELEEEIGTANAHIIAESKNWFDYDLPPELVTKVWAGKYRGQTQKWFLLRFLGDDSEINLETEHPEFLAWQWSKIDELTKLIVPFKRELYGKVITEFSTHL